MSDASTWRNGDAAAKARILERRWQQLCAAYLPIARDESIWRYHRASDRKGPACGWKLHVSATVLNAAAILDRIAPLLERAGIQFKAARSLAEVARLNSGLHHSYTQIGKIITVYPRNDDEAVLLADELYKLTRRFNGPSVPFDSRFKGNIYYRYGAFQHLEIEESDGRRTLAMTSPIGELVPDSRETAKPDWVLDPFAVQTRSAKTSSISSMPPAPFRVLRALVQRGKGGVYQAVDLRGRRPRLCLLKEGRKHGEVGWDGRDGAWRVRHEERVLKQLLAAGVAVPEVYSSFELNGNYYLAMKFIDGETLHSRLRKMQRRMPVRRALKYASDLAGFLTQMHESGWTWRDCKPKNIVVTRRGGLVPIDFEGACQIDKPDPIRWGTPGFVPTLDRSARQLGIDDDLYGLGSILYLLLSGCIFDGENPIPVEKRRRGIPSEIADLITVLLETDSSRRRSAKLARLKLKRALTKRARREPRSQTRLTLVRAKAA